MSTVLVILAVVFPAVALTALAIRSFQKHMNGVNGKRIMKTNLLAFVLVLVITASLAFTASAVDADAAEAPAAVSTEEAAQPAAGGEKGLGLLAAGLVTGLAGIGGGIAVAAGAPAAIAATSEDPKSFGKSLIFVALGESIALYGVVISILILNKI